MTSRFFSGFWAWHRALSDPVWVDKARGDALERAAFPSSFEIRPLLQSANERFQSQFVGDYITIPPLLCVHV